METEASRTLDAMLCFAVYRAEKEMARAYRAILAESGLSYTQYLVVLALAADGRLSVGRLGSLLDLDSATLSPLLKRLERRGLVERSRDAADERVVTASLTPGGQELFARLSDVQACLARELPISADETAGLIDGLHTLTHTAPAATGRARKETIS